MEIDGIPTKLAITVGTGPEIIKTAPLLLTKKYNGIKIQLLLF